MLARGVRPADSSAACSCRSCDPRASPAIARSPAVDDRPTASIVVRQDLDEQPVGSKESPIRRPFAKSRDIPSFEDLNEVRGNADQNLNGEIESVAKR
jgi:hypothetical protein